MSSPEDEPSLKDGVARDEVTSAATDEIERAFKLEEDKTKNEADKATRKSVRIAIIKYTIWCCLLGLLIFGGSSLILLSVNTAYLKMDLTDGIELVAMPIIYSLVSIITFALGIISGSTID